MNTPSHLVYLLKKTNYFTSTPRNIQRIIINGVFYTYSVFLYFCFMKGWAILVVIIVGLNFTNCKKKELTYKIEGTVTDMNTKLAATNTTVRFYQKDFIAGVVSEKYTFLAETKTNSSGIYNFETPRTRVFDFKIEIDDPRYYFTTFIYQSDEINSDGVNVLENKIESRSWVKLILNNPFVPSGEQLNLNKSNFKEDCTDCCTNGGMSFKEKSDTTLICPTIGGTQVILNYGEVLTSTQFNKTIDCTPFDTVVYIINY